MMSETVDPPIETVVSRPPGAVIAMSMFWCLTGSLELILWLIERQTFDFVFGLFATVFTVLILKGLRWVFWVNLGVLSLSLGVSSLQLQIPGWAPATPPLTLWIRTGVCVAVVALHQFRSLQHWFGIRSKGRQWQAVFWLFVVSLTVLGQFVLPALKALRVLIKG